MLEVQEHGPVLKFRAARAILGRVIYHTAAYWVDGLLIDTTCAFTAQELAQALGSSPVQQIVNTHSHEDHIGANSLLQESRGARVWAHPLALPILANPRLQHLHPYRRLFWGWPRPSQGEPVGEWVETAQYRFQVIYTPGHSVDHICLYEPQQGWLFTGDTYIGGRERSVRPDYDVYATIASLKKLAALPATKLFPGSGTVRTDPAEDIRRKAAQLEELGATVRHLYEQGLDIDTIKKQILGREPLLLYVTLGHFSGRHLIEAYLRGIPTPGGAG